MRIPLSCLIAGYFASAVATLGSCHQPILPPTDMPPYPEDMSSAGPAKDAGAKPAADVGSPSAK